MITKLTYALRNGVLTSIENVDNGLNCNCVCPACNGRLIAKKGNVRTHHFAHESEHICKYAIETKLHLLSKEVLQKRKLIVIPPLLIPETHRYGGRKITEAQYVKIDNIHVECHLGDIRPDLIAEIRNRKLFVEIAVTHFVDENKLQKLVSRGISCLEIDLRSLKDGFTINQLERLLIEGIENKKWIFNAKLKSKMAKVVQKLDEQEAINSRIQSDYEFGERKKSDFRTKLKRRLRQMKAFAKENKLDLIKFSKYQVSICPKLMHLYSQDVEEDEIVLQLRKGKYWDGEFYDTYPNQYIYLNERRYFVSAFMRFNNFTSLESRKEKPKGRLSKVKLNKLKQKSCAKSDDCLKCKFRNNTFSESNYQVICGYRKINQLI